MSFPRYPKYKDSGVDWLGDVPEHWNATRLGYATKSGMGQTILREMLEEEPCENAVPVFSASESNEAFGYFLNPSIRLDQGDLVIGARGSIGLTRRILEPATCTQTTIWLKLLEENLDSTFLHWCLLGGREGLFPFDKTAIPMLTVEQVRSGRVPLPPLAEQTRIAEFLDRETAKIDELVAEQRRLMALLKEKRQAVISHAVTRGLNPEISLKPSGVPWLGEVPEHWEMQRIKHFTRSIEQGWSPQCESNPAEGDEWGVLKVGCVNGGFFDPTENKLLPSDMEPAPDLGISCDDLLISRANTRELVGSAAIADRDYPKLMLCDKLYRLRFHAASAHPRFIARLLGSTSVRGQIELSATGASASMVNIGQAAILELPVALPPFAEQAAIVQYIEMETAKFDALTAEAQRAIDLLQERRTALISAAVTGRIDVRHS